MKKARQKKELRITPKEPKALTIEEAKNLELQGFKREIIAHKSLILDLKDSLTQKDIQIAGLLKELNESKLREISRDKLALKEDEAKSKANYGRLVESVKTRLGLEKDFAYNPDTLEVVEG